MHMYLYYFRLSLHAAGYRCWIFAVTRTRSCFSARCSLLSASTVPSFRVARSATPFKPDVSHACATTDFRGRKCSAATSFRSTTTSALDCNITTTSQVTRNCSQYFYFFLSKLIYMVGGVAQWLGRRSVAGGLSLIYAWSIVDVWPLYG